MHNEPTFEQSVGQHLVTGLQGVSLDEQFIELVRNHKIGNVILFSRNIVDKYQLKALCADIHELIERETGFPPLITIDEEGGMVSRLGPDATHLPGAMAIGATADQGNAYTIGRISASELRALGIQCNLAPSLDVNSNRMNPVIGVRAYSDNPETVASFGTAMVRGLTDGNVLSVVKHFPGHGDTDVDSHTGLPVIGKSKEELLVCELVPFKAAIEAGVPAIMTSHILYPGIESEPVPATMSRTIVTDLLRAELSFDGLVFSDCLEMGAIKDHFGTSRAAVEAIRAGVDLVFVSHTYDLVAEAAAAVAESIRNGYIDYNEHAVSVGRIAEAKKRFDVPSEETLDTVGSEEHRTIAKAIMARSVCIGNMPTQTLPDIGDQPLFLGCRPFHTTLASNGESETTPFPEWMASQLGGKALVTPDDPTNEEIIALMEETRGATCIVIGTYNGHIRQGQLALANAMAGTGLPTIVCALRNPYDLVYLAENIFSFAVFEYSTLAFEAIRCILTQERSATGVLPIHW